MCCFSRVSEKDLKQSWKKKNSGLKLPRKKISFVLFDHENKQPKKKMSQYLGFKVVEASAGTCAGPLPHDMS